MPDSAEAIVPDRDGVYKTTPQGDLRMHLFLPPDWRATDRRAAFLLFHGGGWAKGSAGQMFRWAAHFAGRGLVAISAEYRLRDRHGTTPEKCVMDARSAMRYLRRNAAALGVDPDRVIAGGSSAGAHLATALGVGCGPDELGEDSVVPVRPQALVCLANCPDTSDRGFRWKGTPDEARGDDWARAISPHHHVAPGCPPAIMMSGGSDVYLPKVRAFARRSAALGNRVDLWVAPGQSHTFHNAPPWLEAVIIKAEEFLGSLGFVDGPPAMEPADSKAILVGEVVAGSGDAC